MLVTKYYLDKFFVKIKIASAIKTSIRNENSKADAVPPPQFSTIITDTQSVNSRSMVKLYILLIYIISIEFILPTSPNRTASYGTVIF